MKRKLALTNGIIYTGDNRYTEKVLLIEGEFVYGIVDYTAIPPEFEIIDVEGKFVCPGLIDLQIYGTGDQLFSAELTVESIHQIEKDLLAQGCTSFYLTLATNTIALFKEAIQIYKKADPQVSLGLHLEGPFLNAAKRGAHPDELIVEATDSLVADLLADQDVVQMMTIAPECVRPEVLQLLLEKGILVSAGHSNATFDQATAAFDRGIRTVTHLWNAMSPLQHRNVGLPGATFNHASVCASIIVDGIHVSYEAAKISKAFMGRRLFLITDAVAACSKGIYQHVRNEDHFVLPDGTLSGSALTMLGAIRNCVHHADIPLDEAIRMATLYPADLIERKDLGRFEKDSIANIVVFDESFLANQVYFRGEEIKN